MAGRPTSPFQAEATATPTPTPPTPAATVTPIPTSAEIAGWLVYENEYFGYRFSYPPEAHIKRQGFTGFGIDEVPENMTAEAYGAYLESIYPNDLCVTVTYETTWVVLRPTVAAGGGHTVPCGVTARFALSRISSLRHQS